MIFYNGSQEQPDRKILRLSDAYCVKEEYPALELTAVMLNINRGHNEKLKGMCKSLKDYSEYTARVRPGKAGGRSSGTGNQRVYSGRDSFRVFETKQSGGETSEYL